MKLSLIHVLVAGALSAGGLGQAFAQQEATGAGASFPAPLYSKWA
ncbi:MAG: phosphate ABC transporter substrate-binding protein PstS, partial [Comamonas sp.]